MSISWSCRVCISQLCVFKEFSYLDLQICVFSPNERKKVHFPLYLQPGPLFGLVSPNLPCSFKISIEFAFQMEFQSLKCDCGKSEGLEELHGSGKGSPILICAKYSFLIQYLHRLHPLSILSFSASQQSSCSFPSFFSLVPPFLPLYPLRIPSKITFFEGGHFPSGSHTSTWL